ncbi:MAG: DUF1015 domain-containing protein [Armatimonadetes bacterium]|nr:DUF1015 domain-containing protein [Armatimonadota bacterium]
MAEVAPFKGIRYDQTVVGDLSKVVSPPYDVISPEDRVYYHKLHPANFVRLVLGEEFETDNKTNNRFTRARAYLDDWLAQGILKQDPVPAIYVYQQIFEQGGREHKVRGFTCAVRLHDYSERVILPHENTLAKPKSQLIELMRATHANLDSIYALYADEAGLVDRILDRVMANEPAAQVIDKNGVRHIQWILADANEIAKIVEFLKPSQIAIADGHHRYETSLAYRNECSSDDAKYTLMTLVNVYQKDMTIFPTHRVIKGLSTETLKRLDHDLEELFEISESSAKTLLEDMARIEAIGMYRDGRAVTLKPKPESRTLISGSTASRELELNVLHKLILDRVLGIDEDKLKNQTHIFYTRDPEEALQLVDSGKSQVAFLLNNIAVKSVLDIAAAGERMPQKATYFYPKLISGFVLRKMVM